MEGRKENKQVCHHFLTIIGHYLSLLEIDQKTDFTDRKKHNMCDEHLYYFDSEADKKRHFEICHDGIINTHP
jgi:hypothetical protein